MLNSQQNIALIKGNFPNLANDKDFRIAEYPCPDFNCIAWAANKRDVFWEHIPEDKRPLTHLDGASHDWPFDLPNDNSKSVLVNLFEILGYEKCLDEHYEDGFKKVALYGTDLKFTHAARQLVAKKGIWTSKLGKSFMIEHGSPFSVEGNIYGKVYQFMKKSMR